MKPNIIMVLVDGLRPKDLSLYGYNIETDKNIKKIASESIFFPNTFSTSGASDTADTSIFSGQYPTTTGFIHQAPRTGEEEIDKLRKNKFWLPMYLQSLGYATISITPQHLWFKKGYDYCMTKEGRGLGKHLNFPLFRKIILSLPNWVYSLGKKLIKVRLSPVFIPCKEIIDSTTKRIKETKEPFFMYMQLLDAHCPYGGVKTPNIKGKTTVSKVLENIKIPFQREYIKKRFFDSSTNSMEQSKAKLDLSIQSVDKQIGRLVAFLKKEKLWDNTIFIILADHGENYGEHNNYFCRGGLYDTSIHIPLIMHLPGFKSKRIDSLVSNIDITPTILDYMGEEKKKIDGKSLIPVIKGKKKEIRNKILAVDGFCKDRIAVRTKSKKLIISRSGRCYLCGAHHGRGKEEYDLKNDPKELKNIYSGKDELEKFLDSVIESTK